jgi:hypothetical protein
VVEDLEAVDLQAAYEEKEITVVVKMGLGSSVVIKATAVIEEETRGKMAETSVKVEESMVPVKMVTETKVRWETVMVVDIGKVVQGMVL